MPATRTPEVTGRRALSSRFGSSGRRVHIPPVDIPRSVTVTYWRDGALVSSGQVTHQQVVGGELEKQAKLFADQYKLDQPPPLPSQ
jgi:hypothetical protein